MQAGVKIKDIATGTGDEAARGKTVAVNVRLFLNHGTELTGTLTGGPRTVIDLKRRNCIAGLRYGQWLCHFSLAAASQAMLELPFMRVINDLIKSNNKEAPQ